MVQREQGWDTAPAIVLVPWGGQSWRVSAMVTAERSQAQLARQVPEENALVGHASPQIFRVHGLCFLRLC